jgi:hypothetical protein
MGEFPNDLKRKKFLHGIKKLATIGRFEIKTGGNHQLEIKHPNWKRPFPIPFKHNIVKKNIMDGLLKIVAQTGEITSEEFKKLMF